MAKTSDKSPAKSLDWSALLQSGNRIFIGSHAAAPAALLADLMARSKNLHDIELVQLMVLADNSWAEQRYSDLFKINALFIAGDKVRSAVAEGRADYTPCFLSEVPALFKNEILPLDAALVMVSPPDAFGYCSLGVSVDAVSAAVRSAKKVIAQINPKMPRTNGYTFIHQSQIHAFIEQEEDLPEFPAPVLDEVTERIGQYVSMLIEDGSTLQLGIGKIPEAVLRYLGNHKDLGVHSEVISDGVMELITKGVINNRKKPFTPAKLSPVFVWAASLYTTLLMATLMSSFYPSEYVNSPTNIARNDAMIAINSAIEVDLTGQVVSDSIGHKFYSGIGGQVDFSRGASMSKGGKPIIALPSTAKNGTVSRIVATITEGGGVVTSRGHVHYVVTEFGVASLRGKSIRERALELIRVAHPKFRKQLLDEVRTRYWVPHYQKDYPKDVVELGKVGVKTLTIAGEQFDLRALNPADERRLQEFFYSHTKETLLLRYNHHPKQMSREKSCTLVSVDQSRDLALCIVKQQGSILEIQAVGRYYLNETDNSAEVAFVTREKQHGKGMAKRLLEEMIRIARMRELNRMLAYVRADNKPMQKVFEKAGFKRIASGDPDEVYLELPLKVAEPEKQ